jgi:hypothetical protein
MRLPSLLWAMDAPLARGFCRTAVKSTARTLVRPNRIATPASRAAPAIATRLPAGAADAELHSDPARTQVRFIGASRPVVQHMLRAEHEPASRAAQDEICRVRVERGKPKRAQSADAE